VNFGAKLIGLDGDDREGSQPLAGSRILPIFPNAAKPERIAGPHRDSKGLLHLALSCLPFEEAVDRMQRRLR
jgi:hypothetical protein